MGNAWRADHVGEFRSEHAEALAVFDKAIELDPENADAWYCKGVALDVLDRYEEAARANDEVLRLRPQDAEAALHKAVALSALKRYAEALAAYEQVLRQWPDEIEAWFRKADALEKLGRNREAADAWKQVLRPRSNPEADVHCPHGMFRVVIDHKLAEAQRRLDDLLAGLEPGGKTGGADWDE
jgi:tetratricopeptide (TPR) repeat protein